ncbi:MAG: hypothetical protein A2V86_14120 [Deltaproteobacteria bacterium RBG_16_49_23]|nr:MAG: hypothetical protein A2V86_14120 [Deltaproteobacteria bacterium RBG_16_49_23]
MIKNLNAKNLACLGELTMDIQIRFTRLKFSGWVVMNKNHSGRTVSDDIGKNLSRMDRTFVKKTNGDNPLSYLEWFSYASVAGDDLRRGNSELCDALEDIFGCIGGKVHSELVVYGEVRRKHEEMPDAPGLEEVCNERPHEACLAHTGCQCEAKGWKISLEVGDRREF